MIINTPLKYHDPHLKNKSYIIKKKMSDNETTEGCLPNPYSVVNGIDDTIENSIFKSKRGKHGPRNEYQ